MLQVEWRYTEEGERVRVSTRTGRILPIPKMAEETPDYKTKATYTEQEKDTTADDVTRCGLYFLVMVVVARCIGWSSDFKEFKNILVFQSEKKNVSFVKVIITCSYRIGN